MIPSLAESKSLDTSVCRTIVYRAASLGLGGLRPRVLLSVALAALCAVATLAQSPVPEGPPAIPGTRNPNRPVSQHPQPAAKQLPSLAEVPANTPVATVKGVCKPTEKAESKDCKTVYTRAEMDRIVGQLAPHAPQASPQQIAIDYVRMLAAATLADERKLQDNPAVAKEMEGQDRLGSMQVLARAFYKQVEEEAGNPTTAEMQQYYTDHPLQFEEGELWRLSIPKSAISRGGRSMDSAKFKAVIDGLHGQAVAGFDFDQIQLQAYKDLGINQVPPPTRLTAVWRSNLSPDEANVFNLQPGEVSPVIDSYTSLVILKLISKQTAPFDSVMPEIRSELKPALLKREIQNATKNISAEFNLKYVGLSTQPVLFPLSGSALALSPSATSREARKRPSSRRHLPVAPSPTPPQPQANP